jgi:Asp-tRNA(Asn)/Glu-tRNA(Gln) amidotransferase A subunit family amidase
MVPVSLGTQTAGSVIRPASFCGVVGYVATRGELSLRGVQPLAQSLDSLGVLARSVEDVQIIRRILLTGQVDLAARDVRPPARLAVLDSSFLADLDLDMTGAIEWVADAAAEKGVEIVRLREPKLLDELISLHMVVMEFEVARNLVWEGQHPGELSERLAEYIELGWATPFETYREAVLRIAAIDAELTPVLGATDAIIAPPVLGPAPLGLASTGSPICTRPWQALGLPAITLPGLTNDDRIPLGVQFIGTRHNDDQLLSVGRWLESVLPPIPEPPQ